ncbi:unnamed protein product, partial [Urochloa humidicola]
SPHPHPPQHIARLGSLHSTLLPLLTPSPPHPSAATPAPAAATPSGQIRAAGIVPPTDRASDPRRGVAALERRGSERLETEEGSSSAVVDPPIMAPDMDSSVEKQGSGSTDPDERPAAGEPKACTECHTTKTPLWRGGPCGPMSLCNACGIRYRKKRREALGLDANKAAAAGEQQPQRKKKAAAVAAAAAAAASKRERVREKEAEADEVTVELRTVGFGKEVVLKQRRRMRRRRRLGEEERAAILLMALSSGIVYA